MTFKNREDAGRQLATRVEALAHEKPVLIALPRGGVPVAYEVAKVLKAPLDVVIVRKIGAPDNPEFGIGAMVEDGSHWLNEDVIERFGFSREEINSVIEEEYREMHRRIQEFRGGEAPVDVKNRTVILIDDGLATGVSATAAARFLRKQGAGKVYFAAPVCAADSARKMRGEVDEVICVEAPELFYSVGTWYDDFTQTTDEEVIELMKKSRSPGAEGAENAEAAASSSRASRNEVMVQDDSIALPGELVIPSSARGLVIFAHGSGSSRHSPRNRKVADALNRAGLATLLFDLLTEDESGDRRNVFDIPLLAKRLSLAARWAASQARTRALPIGLFGASTGGGAALWAAADIPELVHAVVSRGGRPDLAGPRLPEVNTPALLIVGGNDDPVIEMNAWAKEQLAHAELKIVPGATHLFEEPGTLEQVEALAADWFRRHLGDAARRKVA